MIIIVIDNIRALYTNEMVKQKSAQKYVRPKMKYVRPKNARKSNEANKDENEVIFER